MATGATTTGGLADSLPQWIMSARQIRENEGVMPQLVEKQTLGVGLGLTWHEVSFAQLNAQGITETTELDNPQQVSDTDLGITPTVVNYLPPNLAICGNALKHFSPNQGETEEVICG